MNKKKMLIPIVLVFLEWLILVLGVYKFGF